jgi:thioredoxin reductase (NADPH)
MSGPSTLTAAVCRRLAWPVFSDHVLGLLRSAGEVLHPGPGELLWDAGDPYDLTLVLSGGVLLLDRRDDRVVFVIEAGDFVGELGMLMGQRAFLPGVAMAGTELLRVRVEELRKLVEISGGAQRCAAFCVGRPARSADEDWGGRSGARGRR